MHKLYLEAAAEQSSLSCARQKIILSRGAGCDHSWVCMWPAAALPCAQRAPTYGTQRKAAEENCIFGRAQQVLPALSPGRSSSCQQLSPAPCRVTQTPLQQAGHFSLAPPQGHVASHKEWSWKNMYKMNMHIFKASVGSKHAQVYGQQWHLSVKTSDRGCTWDYLIWDSDSCLKSPFFHKNTLCTSSPAPVLAEMKQTLSQRAYCAGRCLHRTVLPGCSPAGHVHAGSNPPCQWPMAPSLQG